MELRLPSCLYFVSNYPLVTTHTYSRERSTTMLRTLALVLALALLVSEVLAGSYYGLLGGEFLLLLSATSRSADGSVARCERVRYQARVQGECGTP
jgi:hypothetical protein